MFNLKKKQNMNKQGFINVFFFLDERNNRLFLSSKKKKKKTLMQGPRSNFEIGEGGGGAPLVPLYWGVTRHFFLLTLYNFKNIGRGGGGTCPTPRSL